MDNDTIRWRKASHSGSQNACVELHGDLTAVRDSKNPTGPILTGRLDLLVADAAAGRFED
jgi:hypothetical protein